MDSDTSILSAPPAAGEMSRRIHSKDWPATPLGPLETWSPSVRTALNICLSSRFPIVVWVGSELRMLYNDAYRPILGQTKHPHLLGAPGCEAWPEIWHIIGPMLEQVRSTGRATWQEEQLLVLDRNGYPEEAYFTYSYSPIPDAQGEISGVFAAVHEATPLVIERRRLRTLRELAARAHDTRTPVDACRSVAETLAENPYDIVFAALYLVNADGDRASLAGTCGRLPSELTPSEIIFDRPGAPWPVHLAVTQGTAQTIDLADIPKVHGVPRSPLGATCTMALALPSKPRADEADSVVLIVGVSPHRKLDDAYRTFLDLVVSEVSATISNAAAIESADRRAKMLAELDQAKTTFFSNVSHEFRTPLTLLLGPLENALSRADGEVPESLKSELRVVHRNGLRMMRLVNTLLDFSRVEAGRAEANFEATDLASLTTDLASSFRSAIENAGMRLQVHAEPVGEPVYVDPDMWEKIVFNLLSNAFKHTFEGEITVSLQRAGRTVTLSVSDTGVGIPPDAIPHLFDRFYRVQGTRSRSHEGSGIGLALVRELARMMGGDVDIESTPGAGSTFRVSIPLGRTHIPPDRMRARDRSMPAEIARNAFLEEAAQWVPEVPERAANPPADHAARHVGSVNAGARVLLADDNADMRSYVRRLLEPHYTVQAVTDGAAALDAARRDPPDLIISDVMMPNLDGFDLVAALRSDASTRHIPIILLSARAGEESRIEGVEAGADDYLVKPFSARELLARVSAQLTLARVRRESVERERELRQEAETLNTLCREVNVELDLEKILQSVTDAGTLLTKASFGAFFYNVVDDQGETYMLYTLSGAPRSAFEGFGMPRNTEIFAPTFRGEAPVRSDDITADPRYARNPPHRGMPAGHLPVRSYLAVPVLSRTGAVIGGLFFGHPDVGVFTEQSERAAVGVAAHAAIAIDNARLHQEAQQELEQRKYIESALSASEQRYRDLVHALPAAVYTCDAEGRLVLFNDAAAQLWGRRAALGRDRWCGSPRLFTPSGEPLPLEESPMARTIRTGDAPRGEEIIIERTDGSRRFVLTYPEPMRDDAGKLVGAVNMLIDVTDQRDADNARALLANIVESSDDAIVSKTADGRITSWNRGAERIFGYTADEIVGRSITTIIPPDRLSEEDHILAMLRKGERIEHFETVRLTKDGRYVDVSVSVSPLRDSNGRLTGASKVARDITAQKAAARALRRSEDRFRLMADAAPVMIWVRGPDKRATWFNKQWLEFTGRSVEAELGNGWMDGLHPEDARRCMRIYGSAFDARQPFVMEYRLRRRDGEFRWVLDHGTPVSGPDADFNGYIGSCIDITEQVRARQTLERQQAILEEAVRRRTEELHESHQRLRLSERMAALGTLSAGLGHDMGNLLVPVRVCVESLERADLPTELLADVREIKTSADYLQQLANGLRLMVVDPARVMPVQSTELKSWWADASPVMKTTLPRGVTVSAHFDEQCWVSISKPALTQAVFNVVQNAGDALRSRGAGSIRIQGRVEGEKIILTIEDDGPGMPREVRERCFEPFFTTKTRGISTGLGLVLVSGFVREAGGTIEVHSEPGKGTRFTLTLPRRPPEPTVENGMPARSAFVRLQDLRLRAFVASELKALNFQILETTAPNGVDIAIMDANSPPSSFPRARRLITLGTSPPEHPAFTELGVRPKPSVIRDALHAAAHSLQTEGAAR